MKVQKGENVDSITQKLSTLTTKNDFTEEELKKESVNTMTALTTSANIPFHSYHEFHTVEGCKEYLPGSKIFYKLPFSSNPNYLYTTMNIGEFDGKNLSMNNFMPYQTEFLMNLLDNRYVMKKYGNGKARSKASTKDRIKDHFLPRLRSGQPNSAMVFTLSDKMIGAGWGGLGDVAGASEIATLFDVPKNDTYIEVVEYDAPDNPTEESYTADKFDENYPHPFHNQGLARLSSSVINTWSDEVYRIGTGQGLDENNLEHREIMNQFKCFTEFHQVNGERKEVQGVAKHLQRLDATASLNNPGTYLTLENSGFTRAGLTARDTLDPARKDEDYSNIDVIELKQEFSDTEESWFEKIDYLRQNYFNGVMSKIEHLIVGNRYFIAEPNTASSKATQDSTVVRTFSMTDQYQTLKYHYEKTVDPNTCRSI